MHPGRSDGSEHMGYLVRERRQGQHIDGDKERQQGSTHGSFVICMGIKNAHYKTLCGLSKQNITKFIFALPRKEYSGG